MDAATGVAAPVRRGATPKGDGRRDGRWRAREMRRGRALGGEMRGGRRRLAKTVSAKWMAHTSHIGRLARDRPKFGPAGRRLASPSVKEEEDLPTYATIT